MKNIKVAAVQMNMVQCWSEKQFYFTIDNLVKKSKSLGAEIVVFPEDIGFCLAWVKESARVQNIRTGTEQKVDILSTKTFFENLSSWFLSKIKLHQMGEWLSQYKISNIIQNTFSRVAYHNNIVIVSGSVYERKINGIFNVCYVFDKDGSVCGEYAKHKLVPLEISWNVKPGNSTKPIKTKDFDIGVCICYDLDDKNLIKNICENGAQLVVAPSGGWRPYPNYPFDKTKECPQIDRAKENNISIVKPYCCGWLFPGLYFQGHTQIVGPKGEILAESSEWGKEKIFCLDVPIKDRKI